MPNIKPVSDLRNYNEVLRDITVGEPVFLTKNGRGRYAILDIDDFKKMQATIKLFNELMEAEKSIKENVKAIQTNDHRVTLVKTALSPTDTAFTNTAVQGGMGVEASTGSGSMSKPLPSST